MSFQAQQATSFVIDFDLAGMLAGLGVDCSSPEDHGVRLDDEQAAAGTTVVDVPGRGADLLPAGPALAAWLMSAVPDRCADADLPDVAYGYHRLAAWAQGQELAAVAEIAARTAARRGPAINDTGQLLPEAAAQVALTLTMSHPTAMDWTGLAIRLRNQLAGTAAALVGGQIDLSRARLMAEATAPLSDEATRAVEDQVLPAARHQTTSQLRASLRRAVLAVDPTGAEKRREHAERHAKVGLYSDADGTATLTGTGLHGINAAAAMARITAMARAMKTAGHSGGLDYLRAYVMLGLLLGTLPLIPPAPDAPPDDPPADNAPPDDPPAPDAPPDDPAPNDPAPDHPAADDPAPDDSQPGASPDGSPWREPPVPQPPSGTPHPSAPNRTVQPASSDGTVQPSTPDPTVRTAEVDHPVAPELVPLPVEPPDLDDPEPPEPDIGAFCSDEDYLVDVNSAPVTWPLVPAELPVPGIRASSDKAPGRPPPGLLDVLLPWSALTSTSGEPAVLGRIGPVTPMQTSQLVDLATRHPGTQWRVILIDDEGHVQAVERLRSSRSAWHSQARAGPVTTTPTFGPMATTPVSGSAATTPVIGRVTVTVPENALSAEPDSPVEREGLAGALLRAANRALASARAARVANEAVGGCAHLGGTATYRPPPRIREFVAARDLTCTFPPCGQPAWRADLDHTVPWHRGGPTCACNLGGRCRTHHKIKQLPGWKLEQTQAGTFRWTTPAGRTHTVEPHRYPS